MTKWNEVENLLKEARKDYLLAYKGHLVGPYVYAVKKRIAKGDLNEK